MTELYLNGCLPFENVAFSAQLLVVIGIASSSKLVRLRLRLHFGLSVVIDSGRRLNFHFEAYLELLRRPSSADYAVTFDSHTKQEHYCVQSLPLNQSWKIYYMRLMYR